MFHTLNAFTNLLSDYENRFCFPSIFNPHNDRRTTVWNFMKMHVAEFYKKLSSHLNFGVAINYHSVKLQSSLSLHKLWALSKGVSTSKANSENRRNTERFSCFFNKWILERGKVYPMCRTQWPLPSSNDRIGRNITTGWKKDLMQIYCTDLKVG